MQYTVQLFGRDWTDDKTTELLTRDQPDGTAGLDLLGYAQNQPIDSLGEAMSVADWLWDAFWATENYEPEDLTTTQFVVAVLPTTFTDGDNPPYTRGYYASEYAPWMHWANVERP